MYRNGASDGLSQADLEAARLGFLGYLRRRRFSPQFISRHAEDLFAQAALEYSRKLAEGAAIENAPGWLIECAWRRTKSQLEAEKSRPRVVSTEKSGPLADAEHDPEDVLLDEDRFRKLRDAVGELSADQRRLLAASYFEGFTVREAARRLRWHPSKAQRAHEGAKRRLHKLLGVDSLDELEIEIGLAAYLSLAAAASGQQIRAGIEAMAEVAGRGTAEVWARAQDLARRFPFGGAEPSTTAALGGTAGRAAGVCATAAVACIAASGVVGPGIGGIDLIGGGKDTQPAESRDSTVAIERPPAPRFPAPPVRLSPSPANPTRKSGEQRAEASASERHSARDRRGELTDDRGTGEEGGSPLQRRGLSASNPLAPSGSVPLRLGRPSGQLSQRCGVSKIPTRTCPFSRGEGP